MKYQEHYLDWKNIPGYNNRYLINKIGLIISHYPNGAFEILKSRIDRAGYETVRLSANGKTRTFFLHRLIAQLFIPNEYMKPHINHKNGKKANNWYENLEWVTHSENVQHGYDTGLNNTSRPKIIDKCTGKIYHSISHASRDLKINYSTCRAYLNGVIKSNKTRLEYLK
jgi:hypothetical protein